MVLYRRRAAPLSQRFAIVKTAAAEAQDGGASTGRPAEGAGRPLAPGSSFLFIAALAQAAVFGLSGLWNAFYDFSVWGPVTLVLCVLVAAVILVGPIRIRGLTAVALGGLSGLLLWSALSMLWAESVDNAWTEVNRLGLYVCVFLLAVAGIRTLRQARHVFRVLAAAMAFLTLYVVADLVMGDGEGMFITYRLADPVGYTNGEAGLFLMAFWLFIAIAEHPGRLWMRGSALALSVLCLDMLVLAQARAVIPALLVSAAILLAIAPGRLERGWALLTAAAGMAIALPWLLDPYAQHSTSTTGFPTEEVVRNAAVAGFLCACLAGAAWVAICRWAPRLDTRAARKLAIVPLIAAPILVGLAGYAAMDNPRQTIESQWDSFFSLGAPAPGSERFTSLSGTRYDLWKVSARQFEDHPLKGVGAGNFATTYYTERSTEENARQPHSLVMQVMGELGLGGLIALGVFVGSIALAVLRRGRESIARRDRRILVGATGAVTVWFGHTSIDWLHILPGVTAIALICAALLVVTPSARAQTEDWFDRAGMARNALLLISVVLIALLAMSAGRQYAGERYRKSGQEELAQNPQAALEDADTALELNSGDMSAYYLRAAAYARLDNYDATRDTLLEAAETEPSNPAPWALLGDATIRTGDLEGARAYYQEALDRNPRDPQLQGLVDDPNRALAR